MCKKMFVKQLLQGGATSGLFLLHQIDDLQRQGSLSVAVPSLSMETSMIVHNIQRIVQVHALFFNSFL